MVLGAGVAFVLAHRDSDFQITKCNHHAIYMTNRYFAIIKVRTSVSIETI